MKSIKLFLVFTVFTSILMGSCRSSSYYHSEVINQDKIGDKMFIELQLNKNGTFNEYIYFGINDSLDNANEGLIVSGTYTEKKDTLILSYETDLKDLAIASEEQYEEIYVTTAEGLVLLEPITFSYHFLRRQLMNGQSTDLRSLPYYATIKWVREGE